MEGGFDYALLLVTLCLIAFGLLMIYSSSSYTAQVKFKDSAYFLKKQAIGVAFGFVAMFLASKFPYQLYTKPLPIFRVKTVVFLYIMALVLQAAVLFVGNDINGAKRWLSIGPLSFQPSELTKVVVILMTAYMIRNLSSYMGTFKGTLYAALPAIVLCILVAVENLSTAIVVALITFCMCLVSSKKKKIYGVSAIIGAVAVWLYITFGDAFRMDRIQVWLDVENHPKGYQILQGLYAIASGGIFGSGLGESMQKLGFIPESQNDMIFSIICEELGLVGAAVVVIMFVILLWRVLNIALCAPDLFSAMICVGVMIHIASQVIINIAVVTNAIPSTGIPLPFISYGGTSVVFLMAEMGIVLGISSRSQGA